MHQILLATDFSDSAERALSVAAEYARALHGGIHLLHISAAAGTDAMRPLADIAARVGHDVPIVFAGRSGDPADEILRYAGLHGIDLIVVGTHGRTGVNRMLLGSVAERVIRGARCPVLVVPMPRMPVSPPSSGPFSGDDEGLPRPTEHTCLVCATPTRDLICAPCRAWIRGDALERKPRKEPPGSAPSST
jgi:nucleotide-binding universal stress UspA family protein